ncbi:MAG: PIN domain-containing protein [Paucibacter sp.]|nr:PIN domain-containing protein [Roseateles sp.]
MLVADSCVWTDHFRGVDNPARRALVNALLEGQVLLLVPDLVLMEVMRGFRFESEMRRALAAFERLPMVELGGHDNVLRAADHCRQLRRLGHTVRSQVDALLASWCIAQDHLLLQRDRDFDPYAQHFGLRLWSGAVH